MWQRPLGSAYIHDEYVRYYATDMWAYACGIQVGYLVRFFSENYWVMGPECIDQEYGAIGCATGNSICHPAAGGAPLSLWVGNLTPVRELTRSYK